MDFFGRTEEVALLRKIRDAARSRARFTVLTGRRRIGKTALLRHALDDGAMPYLHLPVTRQPEKTLCAEFQEEAERVLKLGILGTATRFADLFARIMEASKKTPFTVVLDEFQEFDRIDPAVYGQMAAVWDRDHEASKINLVVCGSVNRMMSKIFFDEGEPLYGRTTGHVALEPFKTSELKEILSSVRPRRKPDDLLSLWTVSGGIARYVDMMVSEGAVTRDGMLDAIFTRGSPYLAEGRAILAEEFGPDYGTYFAILSSIAAGATRSSEIGNIVGTDVNGFLTKLEKQYSLVSKKQPVFGKETSKDCHYRIDDCFFRFWFRFVFKNRGLLELERFDRMRELAARDFDTFSGYALERYFLWKFRETTDYTRMGAWWDRKGENEIDLVCEDEFANRLDFFEIKRDPARFDRRALEAKAVAFFAKNPDKRGRKVSFQGLSLRDL